MKRCRACGVDKPLDDFHRQTRAADGRQGACKTCAIALVIQWQRDNPERHQVKVRRSALKRQYGMTEQDYADRLAAQDGRCAICRRPALDGGLVVDHCHASGAVRGLLCSSCNRALGMFSDRVDLLDRAATYLDQA